MEAILLLYDKPKKNFLKHGKKKFKCAKFFKRTSLCLSGAENTSYYFENNSKTVSLVTVFKAVGRVFCA